MRVFTTKAKLRTAIENYFNGKDNSDIGSWNTSKITDMSYLFDNIKQISFKPITLNWDTRNVITMKNMFHCCKQEFILNFNTRNVTDMSCMFEGATNFNQPLNFNTSNVTNMSCMFKGATNFNQLLNFNTSNVTDMTEMFYFATNFNQPLHFDTSNVTYMPNMFNNAISFRHPIYFKFNDTSVDYTIFDNSHFDDEDDKYLLSTIKYSKLLLFYALNKINTDLLFLCDKFDKFYYKIDLRFLVIVLDKIINKNP